MTVTALPTPPSTNDPATFDARADALLAALPNMVTEINATAMGLNFPGLMANSTTSVAIGTGSKSFTIDTGKTFVAGQSIFVQYTTTPTNWMYGTVTSYNSATGALVVNVTSVLGSGTYALWTVSLAEPLVSARGFSMSGGINTARGTVAMHATTMDLWSQPNIIDGTGSPVTITAIVNAPQAGARRILYPITGTIITHGATFSVDGNASYTTAAGDVLVIEAVTTSTYNVGIVKQDGTAIGTATSKLPALTATVGSNALTIGMAAIPLDFRSATLTSGAITTLQAAPSDLIVSSGSTLGTINAVQSRLAVLAINNAGTVELAVVNLAGGNDLSETGLISTTAEGGAGAADSANVIYSTTARSNVPYRVAGYVESTQATAGTWATAPSTIQGAGGNALTAMSSIGYGQTYGAQTRNAGTTYYNTTGKPIVWLIQPSSTGNITATIAGYAFNTNGGSASVQITVSYIVPSGASYSYTQGAGTSAHAELR